MPELGIAEALIRNLRHIYLSPRNPVTSVARGIVCNRAEDGWLGNANAVRYLFVI